MSISMIVLGALAGGALPPASAGALPQEPAARPILAARPAPATAAAQESPFAAPVRLRAGDGYVKVESPGYACPTLFDVDGDGFEDLVVGQFNGGKMRMYRGIEGGGARGTFGAGEWIKADGQVAQVPGVW
jgi:hypothetical protein